MTALAKSSATVRFRSHVCPCALGSCPLQGLGRIGCAAVAGHLDLDLDPDALDPAAHTRFLRAAYRHHLTHRRQRAPRYVTNTDYTLAAWCAHIGHQLATATPDDLDTFLDRRPGPNARSRACAPMTRRNNAVAVLAFYRWAHTAGFLDANPLWDVQPPKVDLGPPRAVAATQLRQLLDYLEHDPDPRRLAASWLAYGCGLRAAEIAGARVERIVLDDDAPCIEVQGKFGVWGVVPIPAPVVPVLRRLVAGRQAGPLIVSLTDDGEPITPGSMTRMMSRAIREAGLPEGTTLHWLRHAYAQHLRRSGVPIDVVSRLLRHRNLATTMRYLRGWDGDLHAAVSQAFEQAVAPVQRPRARRPRAGRPPARPGTPRKQRARRR